ncbi:MAG: twin-arginine translocation signal domain-containing protein, partial [Candidatus Aminicenantes bacterium]|nr:twin-arginine translocation signal domain-containing protein [Candidatus Aminicenantes bacterium]
MQKISRRTFLKTTTQASVAAAVMSAVPWSCSKIAQSEPGYFESEFGISDSLCQKVL